MRQPTRKEHERVNLAWALLTDATNRMAHGTSAQAHDALRHERRFRGPHVAKALMVEAFMDGYTRGAETTLAEFSGLSTGLLISAALGAEAYKRRLSVTLHPHMMGLAYECKVILGHVPRVAA